MGAILAHVYLNVAKGHISPMEHIDLRLETVLKTFIEDLASRKGRTSSEVARDLAWIGVGIQKEGGIDIVGPLGLSKPLAEIDLGREKEKVAFWIDNELIRELETEFKDTIRSALRQAIRLGALIRNPGVVKITGKILGLERPFATIKTSEIRDIRAKQAMARLQK